MFKVMIRALALCLLLSFPGCASRPGGTPPANPGADPTQQKLKVWIEFSDNPKLFQDTFATYARENSIQVEVVCPAPLDKILAALSSSDAPDIVVLSDYVVAHSIAFHGLTLDLKALSAEGGVALDDIYPSSLQVCQQGGRLACLPWGTDTMALYWNKDLFEAAGLDPNLPPRTMDELTAYADKLTKRDARGNLIQVGFIPDWPWPSRDTLIGLFGGSYYAEDGHALTVNSPANIRAFEWAQQFYTRSDPKKMNDLRSGFGAYASIENGFFAGRVAMMMDGEWMAGPNFIPKLAPELYYGVAPLPVPADRSDAYGSGVVGGTVVVVPAATKDRAATARLLAWMESPAVVADVMFGNANLPSSKQAALDPRFKQIKRFPLFIGIMAHPKSVGQLSSPVHQELADALDKAQERMWREGAAPAQLLAEIQKEFAPKLDEAWKKIK
jgi:multiple sugar transport system substrate-binding protein